MKIDLSRFSGRFRQETRDNLNQLDVAISRLSAMFEESSPERDSIISELMRLIHAIKGGSRMLGFSSINHLCHTSEDFLIRLKEKENFSERDIDVIVEIRKGIERLLTIKLEGDEPQQDPGWLENLLSSIELKEPHQETVASLDYHSKKTPSKSPETQQPIASWRDSTVRVNVNSIDDLLYYGRELTQALDGMRQSQLKIDEIRLSLDNAIASHWNSANQPAGLPIAVADEIHRSLTQVSFDLRDRISDVDRNIRQIDTGAVELRMRPIAELFETIPLQIRELSRSLGKEVDVEFSGESVRLDGRIVELLREPMLHIIRNAIGHGMEDAAVRDSAGKSPRGRVTLGANENAGWARVVVADDGRGIDPEALWNRAIELGIIDASEPMPQDVKSIYNIMFDDRFSIIPTANDVSGRGVGLAAVKRRMQELRGSVSVESIVGMGTKFVLQMPTSLSSQHVLITSTHYRGEERFFAFPTAMIKSTNKLENSLEDVLLDERNSSDGFSVGTFSLGALLEGVHSKPRPQENYLVHCSDGHTTSALAVRQILAETEIIIEPLPLIMRSAEVIAGAAPLTSEQIALVLNIPAILASIKFMNVGAA